MTRLVIYAGTHATDWDAARQQLVSWRDALEPLGIRLNSGDDAEGWTSVARELVSGKPARAVLEAAHSAVQDGVNALVVGSDQLEDPLRDPAVVADLTTLAADLAMPLTVVVVLRDQVGYLNELYCDRVSTLQMARDFGTFAAAPQPLDRFDYAAALSPVLEAGGATLTAIPHSSRRDGLQALEILRAAGAAPEAVDALPPGPGRRTLPGPVLMAASRLLFKRAWRLGLVKTLPRGRLMGAARSLREHAAGESWDTVEFWGWTSEARDEAVRRYQPGNDALASRLWGRSWGEDWADGTYAEADLASCPPDVVVDILGTVDTLVKDLQKAKGAAAPGAAAD